MKKRLAAQPYPLTRLALRHFDNGTQLALALWANATTDDDIAFCERNDAKRLQRLRDALYEECGTHSRHVINLMGAQTIRNIIGGRKAPPVGSSVSGSAISASEALRDAVLTLGVIN